MSYAITAAELAFRNGFVKTVTIPSANILTLHSVGYTLLTAPTNTQMSIIPIGIFARNPAQTAAYTSLNVMNIGHFSSLPTLTNTIATLPATGLIDNTTTPTGAFAEGFSTGSNGAGCVIFPGQGLGIVMASGDPSTGTGSLVIRVNYVVQRIY